MPVVCCQAIGYDSLRNVLSRYSLRLKIVDEGEKIPGSWFGEPEAGLVADSLYIRNDTPVHSALHESCHYICMPAQRRHQLHTNAGGDFDEENAVCYLSILLSDYLPGFNRAQMFRDMDEWGYTFRLGSSEAWFTSDAEDALDWLIQHQLIDKDQTPLWKLRG